MATHQNLVYDTSLVGTKSNAELYELLDNDSEHNKFSESKHYTSKSPFFVDISFIVGLTFMFGPLLIFVICYYLSFIGWL